MFSMVSLRSGSNRSGGSHRLEGESSTELTENNRNTAGKATKITFGESGQDSEQYEMGRS
jgi:hypothetical protein